MPGNRNWGPQVLGILRIITALLFMEHGLMMYFHFPAAQPEVPGQLPAVLVVASWIELIAGPMLVLGLFTAPIAFVCAGEMAAAYAMVHIEKSFWPGLNGGDPTILFCFIFLYFAAAGGGSWSVDNWRRRGEVALRPTSMNAIAF